MFQFNRFRGSSCGSSSRNNVVSRIRRSHCSKSSSSSLLLQLKIAPPPFQQRSIVKKCNFLSTTTSPPSSSSSSWLEGDIGNLGTKIYHSMNIGLAIVVPIYFLTPERYANGYINKTVGFFMATAISLHTYIGMNYVCRDYVPKISSKLLGPARIVTATLSFIMFIGMSKIALYSPNGIKGILTGLWSKTPPSSKTITKEVNEEETK